MPADKSLRDIAAFYWGMHDDMEYPGESPSELTDAQVLQVIRQQYTSSDCGDFAVALTRRTGWPIVNFVSAGKGLIHSAVRHPTGRFVDVSGFVTLEELRRRYKARDLAATLVSEGGYVIGCSEDDTDEEWSAMRLASLVIEQLPYAPFKNLPKRRSVRR